MVLKTTKLIFLLNILITFSACHGQKGTTNKDSNSDSLSLGELVSELDDKIWDVYQDRNDHYWFGSNGYGVFKYDGKKLIRFTEEDGLVDNTIRGIQEDTAGDIYIETPDGISKFNGTTFTTLKSIHPPSYNWKSEPNDLWFNCNGNPYDVYRYDGDVLHELKLPRENLAKAFGGEVPGLSFMGMSNSPFSVFGINKDKAGNLWFGTATAGAFRYDGKSFLWFPEKELSRLPDGRVPGVRAMIEDKDGNFWLSNFISKYKISDKDSIATYEKLEGIDPSKGHFDDRLPYFNSGLADDEGNLWMTTYGGGVWKYDGDQLLNFPVKEGTTEVLLISIYKDNKGTLWLGTDNAGVYKFNGDSFERFEPMKN